MINITYGVGNTTQRPETQFQTVGQVVSDPHVQMELNYEAAEVEIRVNGVAVNEGTGITPNMDIRLVKKAGRKS